MSTAAAAAPDLRAAQRARSASVIRDALGVLQSKWSVGVLLGLGAGRPR